jgi:heme/copper-type cytochrome/quinol oxidase subunit 4
MKLTSKNVLDWVRHLWRRVVPTSTEDDWVSILRRIGFWFISFLLVVLPFSLLVGKAMGSVALVLRITLLAAFPVWCLYLPFIFRLNDANGRRSAILILGGALIGPATILVLWLLKGNPEDLIHGFWDGPSDVGMGSGFGMILASIVGLFTSVIYVLFLKFVPSRRAATKSV